MLYLPAARLDADEDLDLYEEPDLDEIRAEMEAIDMAADTSGDAVVGEEDGDEEEEDDRSVGSLDSDEAVMAEIEVVAPPKAKAKGKKDAAVAKANGTGNGVVKDKRKQPGVRPEVKPARKKAKK